LNGDPGVLETELLLQHPAAIAQVASDRCNPTQRAVIHGLFALANGELALMRQICAPVQPDVTGEGSRSIDRARLSLVRNVQGESTAGQIFNLLSTHLEQWPSDEVVAYVAALYAPSAFAEDRFRALAEILEPDSNAPYCCLLKALVLGDSGRPQQASEELRSCLTAWPVTVESWSSLPGVAHFTYHLASVVDIAACGSLRWQLDLDMDVHTHLAAHMAQDGFDPAEWVDASVERVCRPVGSAPQDWIDLAFATAEARMRETQVPVEPDLLLAYLDSAMPAWNGARPLALALAWVLDRTTLPESTGLLGPHRNDAALKALGRIQQGDNSTVDEVLALGGSRLEATRLVRILMDTS
jgi:hypothetical protein